MSQFTSSVLDVSKPDFDVDAYLSMQLKEKSLDELLKEEESMVTAVRRLDSDVHQLVYENYNKFLTATNTVRKIQDEFNQLDQEMESLSSSMKNISGLIGDLSGVLGGQRSDLAQLGSSYKVVSSLKFIFDLPNTLRGYIDERKYPDFVRVTLLARTALKKYTDMENVGEIVKKLDSLQEIVVGELFLVVDNSVEEVDNVEEVVSLLLKLGVPESQVQTRVLGAIKSSLERDISALQTGAADVLDLVDRGCGSFVPNLTLLASMHHRLFPSKTEILLGMLQKQLHRFHKIVSDKFLSSGDPKDCSIVVRALDRYFRKMSTCKHIVPGLDCFSSLISLVKDVSRHEIDNSCKKINDEMKAVCQEVRQALLAIPNLELTSLSAKVEQAFIFHVKTAMANLLLFTASDVTFSNIPPSEFQADFAKDVHETLLVRSFQELASFLESFGQSEGDFRCSNPWLLLTFAVALHHLSSKSSTYLLNLCREQLSLTTPEKTASLTNASTVISILKGAAQSLIRSFVQQRGMQLGESLIKGCEALCQPSASPTGVRAAVRRAVEEVGECDRVLSQLLGADQRKESRPRRAPDAPRDSLWNERIDFHQQIHFNKAAIVTAIVKVLLKSFTECIRLQTYNRTAVEQVQVDCCYLQRYFSPLVTDEVVVNSMVDQALSSALKRCLDPVLIHPSKLSVLCEDKE